MTTPLSLPIWQAISYLHIFQFPWRFLGPAALSLAFLVGATAELLTGLRWRHPLIGLIVLALVAADLGWLWNAQYCPGWDRVSIGSLYTWEQTDPESPTVSSGPVRSASGPPGQRRAGLTSPCSRRGWTFVRGEPDRSPPKGGWRVPNLSG
jgi:hypothetical protein